MKNEIDDIVVISTCMRPETLSGQIISLLENMLLFTSGYRSKSKYCKSRMPEKMYKLRKILFCIVDDSNKEYKELYLKEVQKTREWINKQSLANHAQIEYWSKNKQINLIKNIGLKAKLTDKTVENMFSDFGGKKY